MMAKQYKVGQLITINRRIYRVRKHVIGGACHVCAFKNVLSHEEPCINLCMETVPGKSKLPLGYYLKLVKL